MSSITSVLATFDGSTDLGQTQIEAVSTLQRLADAQNDICLLELREELSALPVQTVLQQAKIVRAYLPAQATSIGPLVQQQLTQLLNGLDTATITSISEQFTTALTEFLSSNPTGYSSMRTFYPASNDFANYRVDLGAWCGAVTATTIRPVMEQAVAVAGVYSLVSTKFAA